MAQICNQTESEYMAYDYMKAQYEKLGNKKMVRKFENCPIRESDEIYIKYFSSSLRDIAMHELGVGTTRDMKSVITGIVLPSLKCKAYTWQERLNLWRCKMMSAQFPVVKDLPIKEFYVFHNSAHSPIFEEPKEASKLFEKILEE